jgi:gliding motility-associated-like protein
MRERATKSQEGLLTSLTKSIKCISGVCTDNTMREFRIIFFLTLIVLSHTAQSQNIIAAEYFFNVDPGNGNATALSIPTGPSVTFTRTISTASLPQGFHMLGLRIKESGGVWSIFETRGFYITGSTTDVPDLVAAEYFIDSDPGIGNGVSIPIITGANINFTIPIPTASLALGFHFISIRTKTANGRWSLFESRGFYIAPSTNDAANLISAEYFFDTDPGQGNGTSLTITGGPTSNFIVPIPTTSLSTGFHFLAIRTKGVDGKWGIFESRGFYISSGTTDVPNIVAAEYFFDIDPGIGNGQAITPITAGSNVNFSVNIPANLSPGFHFLALRTKRADGIWGLFETRGFYVTSTNNNAADIVAAEYFFEATDPGEGNGNAIAVTPGPTVNETLAIATTGLPTGPQLLSLRVQDAAGIWSTVESKPFTVLACTPPAPPTAPNVSRCDAGTVILTATAGATGSQVYRWYVDAITPTILFTGPSYTTPSLATTTTYYVSIYDPNTLCESLRTAVTATVTILAQPVININSVTICEGTSIVLSAPAGFTSYNWSNGETTREILVSDAGNYSVVAGANSCSSPASAAAVVTLSTRPTKPVVNVSGSTALCDNSSVTLTAPAGFSYLWSSGQTTQAIIINTAGNYSVVVINSNGCSSAFSDPIVVTANTTPPKPIIETFGSTTLCGTNTVGMLAPVGYTIYQWSGGQTVAGISIATAGSYTVVVGNATNCLSPSSDPIVVTATGQPCTGGGTNNSPPVIDSDPLATQIEGKIEIDITAVITDTDNNIDFSSIRVVNGVTARGVTAFINSSFILIIDYSGNPFTGTDRVTIEVCDLAGACAQQVIDIDVVGAVIVFNGISPDGDGLNDFMEIKYVDVVEGASKNKVSIYNRWGDLVFEVDDYDNTSRVFIGVSSQGKELPAGTYFYKIDFSSGSPLSGFITLKR